MVSDCGRAPTADQPLHFNFDSRAGNFESYRVVVLMRFSRGVHFCSLFIFYGNLCRICVCDKVDFDCFRLEVRILRGRVGVLLLPNRDGMNF